MPNVGVDDLLENGVALLPSECLRCLTCFLEVWYHFFNAAATLSLKMVGFMVEAICNVKQKIMKLVADYV